MSQGFESYIERHYAVKRRPSKSNEIEICCPFCGDEKFHGRINTDRDLFYCYRCSRGQNPANPESRGFSAYQFLKQAHGLNHKAILKVLSKDESFYTEIHGEGTRISSTYDIANHLLNRLDPPLEQMVDLEESRSKLQLPEDIKPMNTGRRSFIEVQCLKYLQRRFGSQTQEVIHRYYLHYCSRRCRVVIPMYEPEEDSDYPGRLIYYQGRSVFDKKPKYLNPDLPKPVFNLHSVEQQGRMIIAEGVFDVMALGSGAVSILGTALTNEQRMSLLAKQPSDITIALDTDAVGITGALKLADELNSLLVSLGTEIYLSFPGSDPAELGPQAWNLIMSHRSRYQSFASDIHTRLAFSQ